MHENCALADIHGNSIAVDHVLQDIASQGGVDEYWLLGAYAAIGYALLGVLQWITGLPNARLIHGNTDRYLLTGELPWRFQDGLNDPPPAKT